MLIKQAVKVQPADFTTVGLNSFATIINLLLKMPAENYRPYSLENSLIINKKINNLYPSPLGFINNNHCSMDYNKLLKLLNLVLNDVNQQHIYKADPDQFFKQNNFSQEEIITWVRFLMPLKQEEAIQKNQQEMVDLNNSFRDAMAATNRQTTEGFSHTMLMYSVSFYLGVVLIIAALIFAVVTRSPLFSILFGSLGSLNLLTFFIAKPPQRLQESRSEQAKLNAVFYSWFLDLTNWNGYYLQYSSRGIEIDIDKVTQVSATQTDNTIRLMEVISSHISMRNIAGKLPAQRRKVAKQDFVTPEL
jgi:hypothetical protein